MDKVILFAVLFLVLPFTVVISEENKHPIKITLDNDKKTYQVENIGECPLYNIKINALIKNTDESNILKNVRKNLAQVTGITSFNAELGTLEINESRRYPLDSLLSVQDKKIDNDAEIGYWVYTLNYCGNNRTGEIAAE